ncbi:Arginyl-tRNA synthetase [Mucinivorans hirudinis]|uniref:Arginine--tRNA ligase n=1 Tax=Mucinivorans hirudinis TaxID=1433126 RepID=A0A060RAJ4_9BACT|nr:Arginyl-tRNA synthetase [Mucinivorans hirudinis]
MEQIIKNCCEAAIDVLFSTLAADLQIQKTRKEFEGDYTLVTFPLLKLTKLSPEKTGEAIGEWLVKNCSQIKSYNVIKGFLNIELQPAVWLDTLTDIAGNPNYGFANSNGHTVMVEYSSPNTNKPLHLGHIRNNLLGYSVAKILEANGNNVLKVNLVNDRGIHICKSMIAWQRFGGGETPASSGMKGDHLVGKYYVEFDKAYKAQIKELIEGGMSEEQAKREAPIIRAAQEMLVKWEAREEEVYSLWETMNGWVYEGFDKTYKMMGVSFDKIYYESNTYLLGKKLVELGLEKGVFYRRDDGSVWVDLTADGLDEKLLLRADGTSVYMTQDLGTALERYDEYHFDDLTYVVGNEQNYHFQVLKLILKKLGYSWADSIYHLSYGMVELPEGKMKSREGTVVDADDLMEAMVEEARAMSKELGKLDALTEQEQYDISKMIGLGALKYFILKVDPRKTMLFNPAESIDFNGNTAPFIQYTHARIKSLARRAGGVGDLTRVGQVGRKEIELIKLLMEFAGVVREAGAEHSPAVVAQYAYDLAKEYNQYYHDFPILRSDVEESDKKFRLALSLQVALMLGKAMGLLGIEVPERM